MKLFMSICHARIVRCSNWTFSKSVAKELSATDIWLKIFPDADDLRLRVPL